MSDTFVERFQKALSDRYEFERELARGGMAVVYLARDKKLDRRVAVKVLPPDMTTALGAERFLREIRITSRLQHPNVLPLLDSGEADGVIYYVMPYVEGESLRDALRWRAPLPVGQSVRIAMQVAQALAHAHAQGIVHRDIKPENILLSSGQAVVADFGVARAAREAGASTGGTLSAGTLTIGGLAIGTPAYMSPEQAAGRSDVDGRSDVYALACVLFEMLAGRPPFVGATVEGVLGQHVTAAVPDLSAFRSDLAPGLVAAVERALAKSPNDRWSSAAQFEEELRVHLASEVLHRSTPKDGSERPADAARAMVATPGAHLPSTLVLKRSRLLRGGGVAAAAALVLALVVWKPWRLSGGDGGPGSGRYLASVAAMPLDSIGADDPGAVLSEGLTEEIISQLSRISRLKVISKTSVVAAKARKLTVKEIGDELHVQHVLEGAVQRAGTKIRITLKLVDAETEAHVWSETFDRELTDVIQLREEIGGQVASALLSRVGGLARSGGAGGVAAVARKPQGAAYEVYLSGRFCLQRSSRDTVLNAAKEFGKAIELDAAYAPSYAGLSHALRVGVQMGYVGGDAGYRDFASALAAANRAIELDPSSADGYVARALLSVFAEGPPEAAQADVKKAQALEPTSSQVHVASGLVLARIGRYADALAAFSDSADLDPLCPGVRGGGVALTALGAKKYDQAIAEARETRRLDADFVAAILIEGTAQILAGRPTETLRLPLDAFPELKAMAFAAQGRRPEAEAILAERRGRYDAGSFTLAYQPALLAAAYAFLGDVESSTDWLVRAQRVSPTAVDFRLLDSGLFDKVKDSPRFTGTLQRVRSEVRRRVFEAPAARGPSA